MKTTQTSMWKAVCDKDKSHDGRFVFAVRTTRVYCRPSCPSRRPNRENVQFFATREEAHALRATEACARHPDTERNTGNARRKSPAIHQRESDQSVTLNMIGTAVGASPFICSEYSKRQPG
ncbi:MAG: Ada metal-binding domain-containing protein [Candidatus Obscuribacterales bacterium]